MPEHQPQNILFVRAQRHADADFMGALPRGEGRDAVNSDRGEDEREQPECADKSSSNALGETGNLLARFERGHIEHYQIGIQFMDRILDRLAESQRITRRPRNYDYRQDGREYDP